VLGDQSLELAEDVRVLAELELGVDPVLDDAESELIELGDRRLGELVVLEVGERRPAPELLCLVQELDALSRLGSPGLVRELARPLEVEDG
jgi:hypothetical protein